MSELERDPNTGKITKGVAQDTNKHGTAGAPTKYRPEYCEQIISFFNIEPWESVLVESEHRESAAGAVSDKMKYKNIAAKLPTLNSFARSIGVDYTTLLNWADVDEKGDPYNPEFFNAYNEAKRLQKDFLIQNGLQGHYPPASFIFVAKNITDLQDVQVIDDKRGLPATRSKIKDFLDDDDTDDSPADSPASTAGDTEPSPAA